MIVITFIQIIILIALLFPLSHLLILAVSSIRSPATQEMNGWIPSTRFLILIPAHNEANVIGNTIRMLRALVYPCRLFSIHIIADHCSDDTASIARREGAFAHERNSGPRSGKAGAISWFIQEFFDNETCDAVLIFDADTRVDPNFLQVIDKRLAKGHTVIQGQHIISNPDQGWFPRLTWAMFLIDNRFQNLGRTNLGWSAKNMGDSICIRADVLKKIGWGAGLTEDYQLRQRLLLEGIKIVYEPAAIGYGEAPISWTQAKVQRARWLKGTIEASHDFSRKMLIAGLKHIDWALLDGALQAYFPSYSTMTFVTGFLLVINLMIKWLLPYIISTFYIFALIFILLCLLIYPFFGLALERAPKIAYLAILTGPVFIIWRTWLAVTSRFHNKNVTWIRTTHGIQK